MFIIDKNTRNITMSRGDTGWVPYQITGRVLSEDDRVLWTMKNAAGDIVKQQVYTPVNNIIWVRFENAETDHLAPGIYTYDVRVIIDPSYDTNNVITDGNEVKTPMLPATITLLETVGQI